MSPPPPPTSSSSTSSSPPASALSPSTSSTVPGSSPSSPTPSPSASRQSSLATPSVPPPSGNKLPKFLHRSHHSRDRSRSLAASAGADGPYSSSAESEDSAASSKAAVSRSATRKGSKLFHRDKDNNNAANGKDRDANRSSSSSSQLPASSLQSEVTPISASAIATTATAASGGARAAITPPTIVEPMKEPPTSPTSSRSPGGGVVQARSRTISISRPVSLSTLDSYARLRVNGGGSPARLAEISGRLSGWFQNTFSSSTTDLSLPASASAPSPNHAIARSMPASSSIPTTPSSASLATPTSPSPPTKSQKSRAAAQASSLISHIPGKANLERAVRWVLDSDVAQPDRSTEPIWIMGVEHPGYESPSSLAVRAALSPTHSRDSADSRASPPPSTSPSTPPPRSLSPNPPLIPSSPTSHKQLAHQQQQQQKELSWPPAFYEDFTSRVWLTYRSHYSPIRDGVLSNLEPPVALDECSPLPQDLPSDWWDKSAVMVSASPPKPRWAWGGEKTWTSDTGWGCMLRTGQSVLAEALIQLHLGRNWRRPSAPSLTPEYATYVKILSWFLDTPSPIVPFGVHRMALAGKALGKDVGSWFGPSTAAGAIKALLTAFPEAGLSAAVAVDGTLYESDVYAASNVMPAARDFSTAASLSSGFSSRKHKSLRKRWGGQAVLVLVGARLGLDSITPVYHEPVKKTLTYPQSVGIAGGRPSSSYYFIGYQGDHLFYLDPHHTRPAIPLQPLREPSRPGTDSEDHNTHSSTSSSSLSASRRRGQSVSTASSPPPSTSTAHSPSRSTEEPMTTQRKPAGPRPQVTSTSTIKPPAQIPISSSSSTSSHVTSKLDPITQYYATAYSPDDLRTFHCDRVRKVHVSSIDPSMLFAFLCRDEAEWKDLRARIAELGRHTVFSIQDEPPSYDDDSDSDAGMQSVSEPGSDLSSDQRTFESTDEAELVDVSEVTVPEDDGEDISHVELDDAEVGLQTPLPRPASQPPQSMHFPFPGSESSHDGDADDDWVTPSTPPRPAHRRMHLRSQSLASPPIRSPATTLTPSR